MGTSTAEPSDHEKEILAAYEGHDADIPSNEGYILDAEGELKRRASIALRKSHSRKGGADVDVEKAGGGTTPTSTDNEADDQNVVWWDGPDDPANPLNWSKVLKNTNVAIVAGICFITPLASCECPVSEWVVSSSSNHGSL